MLWLSVNNPNSAHVLYHQGSRSMPHHSSALFPYLLFYCIKRDTLWPPSPSSTTPSPWRGTHVCPWVTHWPRRTLQDGTGSQESDRTEKSGDLVCRTLWIDVAGIVGLTFSPARPGYPFGPLGPPWPGWSFWGKILHERAEIRKASAM